MHESIQQLEQCLTGMLEEHERLLALVRRKQEAMKSARPALVQDCCQLENRHVQRIAELEKQRQRLVGALTAQFMPNAAEPMHLALIADRAGEPHRGRLLVLHQKLRHIMLQVRQENDIAARATEKLLHHVQGMVQQIGQAVSKPTTYGRRGHVVPASGPGVSSFSFTA